MAAALTEEDSVRASVPPSQPSRIAVLAHRARGNYTLGVPRTVLEEAVRYAIERAAFDLDDPVPDARLTPVFAEGSDGTMFITAVRTSWVTAVQAYFLVRRARGLGVTLLPVDLPGGVHGYRCDDCEGVGAILGIGNHEVERCACRKPYRKPRRRRRPR